MSILDTTVKMHSDSLLECCRDDISLFLYHSNSLVLVAAPSVASTYGELRLPTCVSFAFGTIGIPYETLLYQLLNLEDYTEYLHELKDVDDLICRNIDMQELRVALDDIKRTYLERKAIDASNKYINWINDNLAKEKCLNFAEVFSRLIEMHDNTLGDIIGVDLQQDSVQHICEMWEKGVKDPEIKLFAYCCRTPILYTRYKQLPNKKTASDVLYDICLYFRKLLAEHY